MAYALVAHQRNGSTNTNTFTSAAIDTTGANLLILILADNSGASTISDSKSNTWATAVGPTTVGPDSRIFYAKNPTVGTSHTFTATCTGLSPHICVLAFSGADTTSPVDQTNLHSIAGGTTIQPNSITPSVANCLVVTGASYGNTADTLAIDSSFTISDQGKQVNGQHVGIGAAYIIQTSAAAVNPTWSETSANLTAATIASFKPAAATVTPPVPTIVRQAVQRAAVW